MPKIYFIGDIFGRPGREILQQNLKAMRDYYKWDLVIANAENAAGGSGLTAALAQEILDSGVDAITLGDHVWDQRHFDQEIISLDKVLRPANLSSLCPGRDKLIIQAPGGWKLGIVTILGRAFMRYSVDNLLDTLDRSLAALKDEADAILVEVHAEATAEKVAIGWYLDGKVAAVVGTHTHIATADAKILPQGTGYITDVGMTGPYDSVIGMKTSAAVNRFLFATPQKYETAKDNVHLTGMYFKIDTETGKTLELERIFFPEFDKLIVDKDAESSAAQN